MEIGDLSRPGERKKLIWAGVLGLIAIVFLWWTFVGFGSSSTSTTRPATSQAPLPSRRGTPANSAADQTPELSKLISELREVKVLQVNTNVPEAKRNIFAFYEPPVRPEKVADAPPATPTPTPPLLLASVSPSNVYAKTGEFTLEASGDKFTPEVRIFVDGRELQTKFRGPQQLSATVPAPMISSPGTRSIAIRSTDGRVYSNALSLNVAQPPTPNYSYIGLISTRTHVDIALVQDLSTKAILNAQRGDVLSGRFRLTSIADKELVLIDTNLKIKHTIAMTEGDKGFGSPLSRPTPRVDAEDDEPH
jgi:hypothetical protein